MVWNPFKKRQQSTISPSAAETTSASIWEKGTKSAKDLLAPMGIDRSDESHLKIDRKYIRSFAITGFPANVSVGWLDPLFHYGGDMDTALHVQPADDRKALEELAARITQYETQMNIDRERGNIRNLSYLSNKIAKLAAQRDRLESNLENLFHIQIVNSLYCDSKDELNKETQKLESELRGRSIMLGELTMRQDEGFKSVVPYGKSYLPDLFRNFSSGALTACFPFYNSDLSHPSGVLCGVFLNTRLPLYLDLFNRDLLDNGNVVILGRPGSGKTFLLSLWVMRSTVQGIQTLIIDPEGEYKKIIKRLNGAYITISPHSKMKLNPFDIYEEYDEDANQMIVRIDEKVLDLLGLLDVMAGGLNPEDRSQISVILQKLYLDFGITADPNSLYTDAYFGEGRLHFERVRKTMPRFADFHAKLADYAENNPELGSLRSIVRSLEMFLQENVYGMFDCQTSEELTDFMNAPVIGFDVSQLEEGILRPIGMYVALSWTWEKFIKRNKGKHRQVLCDEAWMLVNRNMKGREYTAKFMETCARRIRKRRGVFIVASQKFLEFTDNPEGRAVLSSAPTRIIMRQDVSEIEELQALFKLSDGERRFVETASRGEFLIRTDNDGAVGFAQSFDFERELLATNA